MRQDIINTTPEQTEKPQPKIRKKYTWDMILMILLSAGIMVVSCLWGLSIAGDFFPNQVGLVHDALTVVTGLGIGLVGIIACVLLWAAYAIILCLLGSLEKLLFHRR